MDPLDILNHLLNFVAPAAALALLLVLTSGWIGPKGRPALSAGSRFAILFAVGVVVLAAGLLLWGRDGKMLTYAALVVGSATTQWILLGGWR